jgi:hypothetical protein
MTKQLRLGKALRENLHVVPSRTFTVTAVIADTQIFFLNIKNINTISILICYRETKITSWVPLPISHGPLYSDKHGCTQNTPVKVNSQCTMPRPCHAALIHTCHAAPMPCRVNSHMLCRAPVILRQYHVLRESPRGRRKFPNC